MQVELEECGICWALVNVWRVTEHREWHVGTVDGAGVDEHKHDEFDSFATAEGIREQVQDAIDDENIVVLR